MQLLRIAANNIFQIDTGHSIKNFLSTLKINICSFVLFPEKNSTPGDL